ncbi:hypothetical protein BS50DRAFT_31760 [Corynespora cassiicola Philippines]|uniref:Uncharacterized protein n=1 Tax=Corynespora cassiicola Philippines TaxID=1448308 RepID=A0A2T2PBL5_CORCC|nr:hypothetical protein BS50DRAFT_31760 [Corynespora cassiicola Philippines]
MDYSNTKPARSRHYAPGAKPAHRALPPPFRVLRPCPTVLGATPPHPFACHQTFAFAPSPTAHLGLGRILGGGVMMPRVTAMSPQPPRVTPLPGW